VRPLGFTALGAVLCLAAVLCMQAASAARIPRTTQPALPPPQTEKIPATTTPAVSAPAIAPPAPAESAPDDVLPLTVQAAPVEQLPVEEESLAERKRQSQEPPGCEDRPCLKLKGRVVANLDIDVKCKVGGQIAKLPVDVGDTITEGQMLAELDPVDEERLVKRAQIALNCSETRLLQAKQGLALAERSLATAKVKHEIALQTAQVKAQRARVHSERLKQAAQKSFISQEENDVAEADAAIAASAVEHARLHADELKTQEMSLELKRLDVQLAEAQVENDKLALSTAMQRLKDTRVLAPVSGIVTSRYVQNGSVIVSGLAMNGSRILTLSDLSRLFVISSVDARDVGRIRAGQVAHLSSSAFPDVSFSGKVTRVSPRGTTTSTGVTFEVKIEILDPRKEMLKPEMMLDGVIYLSES